MTKITGLIGNPVSHSLSPHIHSYWAAKYRLDITYKLFTTPAPRLRQTILHMRKKEVVGINITIPHKQAVIEYLDSVDDKAKQIGAVNTVINRDGKFIGSNTDAYGFVTALRVGLTGKEDGDIAPSLSHVILLGAGGAARAAIVALKETGAKQITLINRTLESAQKLASEFGVEVAPWEARNSVIGQASLLVNTTSLGMKDQPSLDIDIKQLADDCAVYDIVYAPHETALLRYAAQRKLPVVYGIGMLLYQAQAAFELWHGIKPEVTDELHAQVRSREAA